MSLHPTVLPPHIILPLIISTLNHLTPLSFHTIFISLHYHFTPHKKAKKLRVLRRLTPQDNPRFFVAFLICRNQNFSKKQLTNLFVILQFTYKHFFLEKSKHSKFCDFVPTCEKLNFYKMPPHEEYFEPHRQRRLYSISVG